MSFGQLRYTTLIHARERNVQIPKYREEGARDAAKPPGVAMYPWLKRIVVGPI
jgi:hypothetical protein